MLLPDPPDDSEAGDEDGVAVVALHRLLDQLQQPREAAQPNQLGAHRRVDAEPAIIEFRSIHTSK